MISITELRSLVDSTLAKALAHHNELPTCTKGCFACCREPVYASRQEVKDILDSLSTAERERLKVNVAGWLRRFTEAKLGTLDLPNVIAYRSLKLWCPLLDEHGCCSVYHRRPLECRLHLAKGPRQMCDDEELRRTQKYFLFPNFLKYLAQVQSGHLQPGETITFDHLCILISEELTRQPLATAARFEVTRDKEGLTITKSA